MYLSKKREVLAENGIVIEREIPLNIIRPNDPVIGTIVESVPVTQPGSPNFCRHIVIDISGTELQHHYEAGQAFGVIPEWGLNQSDKKLRLYSIASPTNGEYGDGKTFSTTVKRVITEEDDSHAIILGTASNYLCDLKVGSEVKLTGPTGKQMLLPDQDDWDGRNFVFVATGTGVAPFRGMLIELLQREFQGEIHLIFGVPFSTDIYYEALFRRYEQKYPHFHFYTAISREEQTVSGSKMYVHDKIQSEWEQLENVFRGDRTLIYLCGLKGMQFGMYQLLLEQRLFEYFQNIPEEYSDFTALPGEHLNRVIESLHPNRNRMRVEVY